MNRDLTEVQETVYQRTHDGKIHLDPNCQYIRHADDVNDIPSDSLKGHKELCSWCEDYYSSWNEGISLSSQESECNRCGKRDIQHSYCNECLEQITIGR